MHELLWLDPFKTSRASMPGGVNLFAWRRRGQDDCSRSWFNASFVDYLCQVALPKILLRQVATALGAFLRSVHNAQETQERGVKSLPFDRVSSRTLLFLYRGR